jgi:hypothetical protein
MHHLPSMSFLLFAAAVTLSAPAIAQQVSAPSVRIGDTWEFEAVDDWTNQVRLQERQEVIGSMQEFVRIRTESKVRNARTGAMEPRGVEEETQRLDLNVDFPAPDGGMKRRVNYAWPLEVGKKWTYDYTVSTVGANNQPIVVLNRFQAEVAGWESVTTPAGSFRALKVVHKGTVESAAFPAPSRVAWTFWYAPDAGTHVKTTYQWDSAAGTPGTRTTNLLTSFKRGGN